MSQPSPYPVTGRSLAQIKFQADGTLSPETPQASPLFIVDQYKAHDRVVLRTKADADGTELALEIVYDKGHQAWYAVAGLAALNRFIDQVRAVEKNQKPAPNRKRDSPPAASEVEPVSEPASRTPLREEQVLPQAAPPPPHPIERLQGFRMVPLPTPKFPLSYVVYKFKATLVNPPRWLSIFLLDFSPRFKSTSELLETDGCEQVAQMAMVFEELYTGQSRNNWMDGFVNGGLTAEAYQQPGCPAPFKPYVPMNWARESLKREARVRQNWLPNAMSFLHYGLIACLATFIAFWFTYFSAMSWIAGAFFPKQ